MKKAADKILYKRKRNEGKGFKDISDRDVRPLKTTIVDNPLLTIKEKVKFYKTDKHRSSRDDSKVGAS